MPNVVTKAELPPVPAKRYFTIGEVSELCLVKQHVLRYWEQEFHQLKPMKRRGNRRYYQHHEVMLIRRIKSLLYEEGFTISGARLKLDSQRFRAGQPAVDMLPDDDEMGFAENADTLSLPAAQNGTQEQGQKGEAMAQLQPKTAAQWQHLQAEIKAVIDLLEG